MASKVNRQIVSAEDFYLLSGGDPRNLLACAFGLRRFFPYLVAAAGLHPTANQGQSRLLLRLDEPAAGLNPRESAELTELLRSLAKEQGIGILLIEHDMSVVMNVSDHIVVLNHGEKIAEGCPAQIKANPDVVSAYLGEDDDSSSDDPMPHERSPHA